MIVRDTTTIKKYISINASVEFDTLKPYILTAERKFIKTLLGAEQYNIFDVQTAPTDATVLEAYHLAQEAICNFGLYIALPILKTQISETGIYNASSENVSLATDKDFKELQRSFKTQGHEALDELFKVMEANLGSFTEWTNNDVYKSFNNTLVKTTQDFNSFYHIFNSRQTFLALKPEIVTVENQYIKAVIGAELLTALRDTQTNENRKSAKQLLQASIVAFTIAKVVQNGLFRLTAEGITMRFSMLPFEKPYMVKNEFLNETQKNKIAEAEQYLKEALAVVTTNPGDFTEYTAPEATETNISTVINTDSITMI